MFVAPDDNVQKIFEKVLREVAGFCVAVAGQRISIYYNGTSFRALDLLVLMHTHQVEPFIRLHLWTKELDLAITKCAEKTLVPDIGHAVQRQLGGTLLEENWGNDNVVIFRRPTKVVDQARDGEEIECT